MTFCTNSQIAEIHTEAKVTASRLIAAQKACEHEFVLQGQQNRILGQSADLPGRNVFVKQKHCPKCGHYESVESVQPECIACGAECKSVSDDYVRSRLQEFQDAQGNSRDRGSGLGMSRGYLCTSCDKPHVFVLEGD